MSEDRFLKLSNGVEIPKIMIGTYPLKGFELVKTVRTATKLGYLGLDAASAYGNERWVGLARESMPVNKKSCLLLLNLMFSMKK